MTDTTPRTMYENTPERCKELFEGMKPEIKDYMYGWMECAITTADMLAQESGTNTAWVANPGQCENIRTMVDHPEYGTSNAKTLILQHMRNEIKDALADYKSIHWISYP